MALDITLRDHLSSLIEGMGYEFVGCELQRQGRGATLRIYIDSEQGIKLDDCSRVSHQVSAMLDVEDPIKGNYQLEISSPGLDRPLFEIEQYQKYISKRIRIRLALPMNNRRVFVGTLLRIEGTDIHLLVDADELVLPFSTIEKANLVADVG